MATDPTSENTNSRISFVEYMEPSGEKTVLALYELRGGKQAVIAHIREDYDRTEKKKMYRTYDVNDSEILVRNYSLKQVKKEIQRHEDFFARRIALQEESRKNGYDATEVVMQGFLDWHSEDPKERKDALKEIRKAQIKSQSRTR